MRTFCRLYPLWHTLDWSPLSWPSHGPIRGVKNPIVWLAAFGPRLPTAHEASVKNLRIIVSMALVCSACAVAQDVSTAGAGQVSASGASSPLRTTESPLRVDSLETAGATQPVSPDSGIPPTGVAVAAKPKPLLNVAILPFTGNSAVSTEELSAITSRFESELMAQGTFRVLERRNVDAILREQGFQQSGACNTSNCQVEVGQMLGVERIITGEVTRMEKLWSLSLRVVEVGSGAVSSSHVLDLKGKLETVLRGGCPEMAEIIAGKKQPTGSRTVLAETKTGVSPWVWVAGGGVLVGGGLAAAMLLTQDNGRSPAAESVGPRDISVTLETGL